MTNSVLKLGILGSTRGTNMLAIFEAIQAGALAAEIKLVISNKPAAIILERAKNLGLASKFIDPEGLSRVQYDAKVSKAFQEAGVDVIVMIGYMRIVSAEFVQAWEHKIINIHPSLLPLHAGLMDLNVHQAVLTNQEKVSGCTVHYVTAEVDAGPVLLQKQCPVLATDTAETLKTRVQDLEGPALIESLQLLR